MALKIKEIAKKKGIAMGQIAERLGVHQVTLSASLNGNPTLGRLEEVAKILEVDVAELFECNDKKRVQGYVEYLGRVHKIESLFDLKQLVQMIDNENK